MAGPAKTVTEVEVALVAERLARAYPWIHAQKTGEGVFADAPLASLIRAILSQNTTDINRDRAFHALRARYPDWRGAAEAPVEELAEVIRQTNYAYTKAGRIREILRRLREERGEITLEFLRTLPTEEVRRYLRALPGVGAKSAAIVALFALGRPVMPIDTHVYRVTQRLGWIDAHTSPERAHDILAALIPPGLMLPLHTGLWAHGHVTCRPVPRCAQCAIYACCIYPAKTASEPALETAIARTALRAA